MTVDLRLQGLEQGRVLLGPETVHLDITNGCNTNCVTCWDHSPWLRQPRAAAWKRQRVDLAQIVEVLDDLARLGGVGSIILSGMGEPFTHPQVYDMIAEIKKRGLHLTVITNLIAADPARILQLGVDTLLIGIHGASRASYQAFHPSFRGQEWEQLQEALETFAQAGRRFKHVQVICRHNAHELSDMVRLAHRARASQVNFKLASLKDGTEAVAITESQRQALLEEGLRRAHEEAARLQVATNLEVLERQLGAGEGHTAPIAEVGCFMGHYYARVLVDGTVLYCCSVEVVVGHLSQSRFSELWDGPAWNELRQRLRQGRYFPSCRQCGKLNQNIKIGQRLTQAYGAKRSRGDEDQ